MFLQKPKMDKPNSGSQKAFPFLLDLWPLQALLKDLFKIFQICHITTGWLLYKQQAAFSCCPVIC